MNAEKAQQVAFLLIVGTDVGTQTRGQTPLSQHLVRQPAG